tara:strand:- start:4233 stop:5501 length:1269 start_codon:yes stop_codon:yes gene_type:complete
MLRTSIIKKNTEKIISSLKKKNFNGQKIIKEIISADKTRIEIQKELNDLQNKMNSLSKEIGICFSEKNIEKAEKLKSETLEIKSLIQKKTDDQKNILKKINELLITIPNTPNKIVPIGNTEKDNEIIKTIGKKPHLEKINLPHWEIAKKYDLINFEKGNVITGSGFPLYKNKGAKLQRSLINFFLDCNIKNGYTEYLPPHLVNENSAFGTGNFPDKEGQMYHIEKDNLYLIPTAEVPLTNIFRNEIIESQKLPKKLTAYTPCFRREAGSYGKNVRGLNRLHQFDKVEIVKIVHPEKSHDHLEEMIEHVSSILEKLELPYRLVKLCGGDLSFSSSLTYDFEVFSAAQNKWLEVSSVSNFESFQATRSNIKFRENAKLNFCHTLNGSALALPRIMAAILENNQTESGIKIPEVLSKYTGFKIIS